MSTGILTKAGRLLGLFVDIALDALFTLKLHVTATDIARAIAVLSLGVVFGLVVSF